MQTSIPERLRTWSEKQNFETYRGKYGTVSVGPLGKGKGNFLGHKPQIRRVELWFPGAGEIERGWSKGTNFQVQDG